jgi:hypothetical protein
MNDRCRYDWSGERTTAGFIHAANGPGHGLQQTRLVDVVWHQPPYSAARAKVQRLRRGKTVDGMGM